MGVLKAGNGKYKIGKNGPAIYKTAGEAMKVYTENKIEELRNALCKTIRTRNGSTKRK
jgi:hypothetical protein